MALAGIHGRPSVGRTADAASPPSSVAGCLDRLFAAAGHTGHGSCGTMVLHETNHAMTSPIPPFTVPPAAIARAGVSTRRVDRREVRG